MSSTNFLSGSKPICAADQNQKRHNQQHGETLSRFSKILVIGLGQLGLSIAKFVKERGFDTYGYDINRKAIKTAHTVAGIRKVTDFDSDDFDVYIISISLYGDHVSKKNRNWWHGLLVERQIDIDTERM